MDIYLVRIRENPDKSLWIERRATNTVSTPYIAISHVWGDPATIDSVHVNGIGPVQLSPRKRDVLALLRRPDICGSRWFWMDLFCINQNSDSAISISDQLMSIPLVYKSSQCVKVLVESPVCTTWHATASRVAETDTSMDILKEEELRHSRKCCNMLFLDPWFERLWTRQEGLYAMKIQVIVLNPVPCARYTTSISNKQKWVEEGTNLVKRGAVEWFIDDKLAYHGLSVGQEKLRDQFYLDLVYRHRVEVANYGGIVGPHKNYSPIREAWKSGRKTTKARDYVLAVFPDINGYRPPTSARRLSFQELLSDALQQLKMGVSKVPRGMMTPLDGVRPLSGIDSASPWILEDPTNISEAFDSFFEHNVESANTDRKEKFFLILHPLMLEPVDFSERSISSFLEIWKYTADVIRHAVFSSPTGPCTGTLREVQTKEGLLHRYFVHQFIPPAVAKFSSSEEFEAKVPTGIVDLKNHATFEIFSHQFKRFMVCLLCGITLRTADTILKYVEFRWIQTTYGKLLAIINGKALSSDQNGSDLILISTSWWDHQGFLVGIKGNDDIPWCIVGRTLIPNTNIWDNGLSHLELLNSN